MKKFLRKLFNRKRYVYIVVNNAGVISYNGFSNEKKALKYISDKPSLFVNKFFIE